MRARCTCGRFMARAKEALHMGVGLPDYPVLTAFPPTMQRTGSTTPYRLYICVGHHNTRGRVHCQVPLYH